MTIKEFVLAQEKNLGINDWIDLIKKNNLERYENEILQVADSLNLISINYQADFKMTLNRQNF